MKVGKYEYPNDVLETVKINKRIRDEFNKFCKLKKIKKSGLIEELYKLILVNFRSGLYSSDRYSSKKILGSTIGVS
jgi:hypothetical protein